MTFGVVWLFLAAALCAAIALWGWQISGFLGHGGDHVAAAPVARTAVPRIVTDYTPNASSSGCLFSQTTDGMLTVISEKTGSLLTEAQAANCSK